MKQLIIYYDRLILNQSKIKFDTIGAFASGLCMLHCIATPFFFIASACSSSCCSAAPSWWQWIDYGFLGISFFSIYQATKSTTKSTNKSKRSKRIGNMIRFLPVGLQCWYCIHVGMLGSRIVVGVVACCCYT